MKLWISLGAAVVLVFTAGILFATLQTRKAVEAAARKEAEDMPPLVDEGKPQPKVEVVGGEVYDFGRCEPHNKGSHSFKLKNVGEADLHIKPGEPTCKCTISGVERTVIHPGETVDVAVEWKPVAEDPNFRQTAPIFTNDRDRKRVNLVVHGVVTKLLSLQPESLTLPGISSEVNASGKVLVYSPIAEDFEITGHTFSDADTAKFYEISFEPPTQVELDSVGAKSGHLATILIKPGLPLGRFQQTIRLKTDIPLTPEIELPVTGTVTGQLSLVGDDWEEESGILTLGTLTPTQGAVRDLQLCVRGLHQDLKIEKLTVKPNTKVLTAEIVGEPTQSRNGKVTTFQLRIAVPKGAPPVNCLGWGNAGVGQVLVETTHPTTPKLRIMVKFAVREE